MAVIRDIPVCPHCGAETMKAIYFDNPNFMGDSFIRWEPIYHICPTSTAVKPTQEWETILKGSIYIKLTNVRDSNGMSLPCKVRTELEDMILEEFKKRCEYHGVKEIKL